eukprot:scaffold133442_cov24-Tisochrysis_lutea.AAC.1
MLRPRSLSLSLARSSSLALPRYLARSPSLSLARSPSLALPCSRLSVALECVPRRVQKRKRPVARR